MKLADLGDESCLPDLLGISVLQNELQFELGEKEEIFEGYGRVGSMYPYRQYDNYHRDLHDGSVEAAILENECLRAVFLTEYGGRLWELWDKERGENLLYTNDVLRYSNLASRNAWFSGGVEWNIGVIGHCPFTTEALYTAETKTQEGYPVLRMYQYERIRKVIWQMDFWLGDDPFLNCAVRICNENPDVVPMYWWSNIAVPEHPDGRVIVPADSAYTNKHGLVYKVEIPLVEGIDITDYGKIPYSVDYFFDIPEDSPKYIANINAEGYGLLHLSSDRLRSRKLFSWGHQEASAHWQEFLTDRQGPYIEIQAGLCKTQYGCLPLAPHTTWEWVERYGAVQIPPESLHLPHAERAKNLTASLKEQHLPESLASVAAQWSFFAGKEARMLRSGKQHGALAKQGKSTAHLRFEPESESLLKWQAFFRTGILHQPDPNERPDEFMIDQSNLSFMEQACQRKENAENWYAFYHLGLGYFVSGAYSRAVKALLTSCDRAENPWARHALACAYRKLGYHSASVDHILSGMRLRTEDLSYLKEGFRILFLNEAFDSLCDFYDHLGKPAREIGKLKYYRASAAARLGQYKKALSLLEDDGGIETEDVREGENSLEELWEEVSVAVYGEKKPVPYRYNFKTSED